MNVDASKSNSLSTFRLPEQICPHLDPDRVGVLDAAAGEKLLVQPLHLLAQLLVGRLQLEVDVGDVVLLQAAAVADVDEASVEVVDDVVARRDGEVVGDLDHPVDVAKRSVLDLVGLRVEQGHVGVVAQQL